MNKLNQNKISIFVKTNHQDFLKKKTKKKKPVRKKVIIHMQDEPMWKSYV